ncbi:helix-turn-helix domain-containing protein [Agrobacterium tumefaciens]|nr:helix-turn-helix domain-containing protein [Agrobacterium tumefaciens]
MKIDPPTLLFKTDTRDSSLKNALAFWEQSAGSLYDFKLTDSSSFYTRHLTFRLGDLLLTHCESVAQTLSRSSYRIAADGYEHFEVQFFLGGRWRRQDGRAEAGAGPGDLVIHDTAQAHAGSASDFSNITLFVPRLMLARLLNHPDEQNMRVLAASQPMVVLLRKHIDNIFHTLPLLDESQAAALVQPTIELVAATLNGVPREDSERGVAHAQREEIRRHIDAMLPNAELSPARIAATFNISVRKLTYLFSPDGGVASYILKRRLEMARKVLRNPAHSSRSVADIGLEHGFLYAHNFTRAFQRVYGITPREIRALAQKNALAGQSESQTWFYHASRWGR